MSKPLIESIAENIVTTLETIKIANGYNQDLTAYRPVKQDFADVSPTDGLALVDQSDPEAVPSAAMTAEWRVAFVLEVMVLDSDFSTDPIDTRINKVTSDITKAFMADESRGGLAIDTQILPSVKFNDDAGAAGVAVPVSVHFRHKYDDPTTQI